MPAWTLGTLMTQATTMIGYRSDLDASDVSLWVNQAYSEVADSAPDQSSERIAFTSISSGQSRLQPPGSMREMLSLSYMTSTGGSNKTLERVSIREMDAKGFFPSTKPTHFAEFRDWIELWPSPNSGWSIQMRYNSYVTDMTATSDVPSLSTPWRLAVLYLSEAHLHRLVGNSAEEAEARARYFGYVTSLKDTEARRQAGRGRFTMSLPQRKTRWGGSTSGRSW